jgi:hypothetical protein
MHRCCTMIIKPTSDLEWGGGGRHRQQTKMWPDINKYTERDRQMSFISGFTSCVPPSLFRQISLSFRASPSSVSKKMFADKMERWCCTDKKCKCYIKCNESANILGGGGGNVMHNHEADGEACLNRQILNNSVKRKAMEDLCERPRRLLHKEGKGGKGRISGNIPLWTGPSGSGTGYLQKF